MRRLSIILLLAAAMLGTVGGGSHATFAQDIEMDNHPAVGSWIITSDLDDAEYFPRLVILSGEGAAFFVSGSQTMGVGAWEPMDETTAAVSFTVVTNGPPQIVIRAGFEVAPDGQSSTGTFTTEAIFDPVGGGSSGEIGPGTLDGTRLVAEAPGTPSMPFEDFFAVPESSREATPVD